MSFFIEYPLAVITPHHHQQALPSKGSRAGAQLSGLWWNNNWGRANRWFYREGGGEGWWWYLVFVVRDRATQGIRRELMGEAFSCSLSHHEIPTSKHVFWELLVTKRNRWTGHPTRSRHSNCIFGATVGGLGGKILSQMTGLKISCNFGFFFIPHSCHSNLLRPLLPLQSLEH